MWHVSGIWPVVRLDWDELPVVDCFAGAPWRGRPYRHRPSLRLHGCKLLNREVEGARNDSEPSCEVTAGRAYASISESTASRSSSFASRRLHICRMTRTASASLSPSEEVG